ncbi:hypothetical protein PWT90_08492 [Aphanocladium album]|nr:hypothetical protein PWT90_08492 [Aphanocladium album]
MCRPQHLRRGNRELELGPTTTWDIACVAVESIKALLLAAGADLGARNDRGQTAADVADEEATAAAEDREPMAEQLAASGRREAEKRGNLDTWQALVLGEVTRTRGGIDKVPLRDLMNAVGVGGFGRGRVSAPLSSLSDSHRKAIAGILKWYPRTPTA